MIERALRWSRNGSRGGLLWIGDRQRQPPAQAVQLCDEMGRQRAAVARSKRPHVGVPGTERRPLPNALGGEQRGDALFAAHALLHQEFPLPMRPLRVFLFHGRHDHGPAGTGIAGKLCGQDAKEPTASSRSVLARRAPRVTKMLVGSTTWLITPCAERSRCNQNPSRPASKQLTTPIDASSG